VDLPAAGSGAIFAAVDWSQGVGPRLAALSLDRKGRLTQQLMPSAAVRCGVLFDLALAGRLRLVDDGVEIDVEPTAFPAADDLLAAMRDEPERTLDSWFAERRFGALQVAESLVQVGSWRRHTPALRRARYEPTDAGRRERDLLLDVTRTEPGWEAPDAAVAAFGVTANLLGGLRELGLRVSPPVIPPEVLAAAGQHGWLLRSALEHLTAARNRYAWSAGALETGA
jgi:hypothetical protein